MRYQQGYLFESHGAYHIRYYMTVNGERVQKSELLHVKDDLHFSKKCPRIQALRQEVLKRINGAQPVSDMTIADFWEKTYLPFVRENLKPSTVSGYEQIWTQHLSTHFGTTLLTEYRTHMGSQFLLSLTKKRGLRTLNHIRSLASGIFSHAINIGLLEQNPWHDVKILGKVKPVKPTQWYTLEEAENIISALVERVDCQLVMALSCFLGLRPGEIAALRWEDFDDDSVHIRRAVWQGVVGTTKTLESVASLPLVDRVALFLNLWRKKSGKPKEGWVFPNGKGKPTDLRELVRRTIRPAVWAAGLTWKGLYAGRRGAGTAIIGLTNGNYIAAQELLRHKHASTTLQFYKKQTQSALADGVKAMNAALALKE